MTGLQEDLTDEAGEIVWECSYQLWGKPVQEIAHTEIQQNLRYQGQYLDRETGLHYNTFRYYDPDTGRFTQPDPIGLAGGYNLYQYALNGLTWIDPWGLTGEDVTGRPLSSPNYSVWFQTEIPSDIHTASRSVHFQNTNKQLYEAIQKDPNLAKCYRQRLLLMYILGREVHLQEIVHRIILGIIKLKIQQKLS